VFLCSCGLELQPNLLKNIMLQGKLTCTLSEIFNSGGTLQNSYECLRLY